MNAEHRVNTTAATEIGVELRYIPSTRMGQENVRCELAGKKLNMAADSSVVVPGAYLQD